MTIYAFWRMRMKTHAATPPTAPSNNSNKTTAPPLTFSFEAFSAAIDVDVVVDDEDDDDEVVVSSRTVLVERMVLGGVVVTATAVVAVVAGVVARVVVVARLVVVVAFTVVVVTSVVEVWARAVTAPERNAAMAPIVARSSNTRRTTN